MIKIPSFDAIASRAAKAFKRFPFTILCSMAAACIAMYLFEKQSAGPNLKLINLMLSLALGIPLFFSASVLAERQQLNIKFRGLLYAGAAVLLALIFWSLPADSNASNIAIPYIRCTIFNVTFHLVASFAAYLKPNHYNGFWQYNKSLFLRILESILYSGFLYTGLALAMGALELLFDVDIDEKLYFHLFLFIVGFFNTWFFVSGIPADFDSLEADEHYPKSLKIFTQYVLLPLLIIYLVILYSYGLKIILSGNWPEGIVSYLIICVAVVGIFLVLLLYPYQKIADNNWIKRLSTIYYTSLLPLVVMLFVAIGMRIGDYGVTINRYLVVLLGVWLSIVCLYFLIRRKNIKFIPMTLAGILLITSYGPWSIFSVSESSQLNRLQAVFENSGLLENGKIKNQFSWQLNEHHELVKNNQKLLNEGALSDSLHQEVKSILEYLDDFHDLTVVQSYLDQDVDSLISMVKDSSNYVNRVTIYMESMGLPYYQKSNGDSKFYNYTTRYSNVDRVTGYDYIVNINANKRQNANNSFDIDSITYQTDIEKKVFRVTSGQHVIAIDLTTLIDQLHSDYGKRQAHDIPQSKMLIDAQSDLYNVRLIVNGIGFENREKLSVSNLNGKLLLKKKE